MPRQFLMTWVVSQSRWTKKYRGHIYSVSCRQLGTPANQHESYQAANRWWQQKVRELDAAGEPARDPVSDQAAELLRSQGMSHVGELMTLIDRGEAARRVLDMLCDAGGEGAADGSPATARHAMLTMRRLVRHAAGRGLIPLLLNITSSDHTFGGGAVTPRHFTTDEIKAALTATAEKPRPRLYMLLN